MPKTEKCIPCLGKDIRKIILGYDPSLAKTLEKVQDCEDNHAIQFCLRLEKLRSKYQAFVSLCMKEQKTMKECASEWKKNKELNVQPKLSIR